MPTGTPPKGAKGTVASVLMLTQVYVPDEASVGQHLADLASALVAKGRTVQVITSDRGYDEPRRRFSQLEARNGIAVRRIFAPAAPKKSISRRILAGVAFLLGACWWVLGAPRFDVLVVPTSPPMAPLIGIWLARLRRARCVLWLTDINPDQAIAAGAVSERSLVARIGQWWKRRGLRSADAIVTLDEDMRARAIRAGANPASVHVIEPWSIIEGPGDAEGVRGFRRAQGWENERVVMYAGNHTPVHPLDTLLEEIPARPAGDVLRFAFVGGGLTKPRVEALSGPRVSVLPYQPKESLSTLLAAADVHVVSMGDAMQGIVHPSKFYGAIAAGRPVLLLGSPASVHGKRIREHRIGWVVPHGDRAAMRRALDDIAVMPETELNAMGARALAVHKAQFEPAQLRERFVDVILG
ncbi:MAG TPA: glycosyltransferase family 4 protein [Gemmatimonadaceae bacterium]|nr:glycosyltransferase family 4 protein [Gemmatimonadaceae bacterium]